MRLWQFRKVAELSGNVTEDVDLFNNGRADSFKKLIEILALFLPRMLQMLEAEFHWCQWVLDFMCNLLSHFAPGTLTFTLCKLSCALIYFLNHSIVFAHQL